MPNKHSKGKVGSDGVVRYYIPEQHSWLTRQEIEQQNKATEKADKVMSFLVPILFIGAFLYMLIDYFVYLIKLTEIAVKS